MSSPSTAFRRFGAMCQVTGTAATQYSRVCPPALPWFACHAIATAPAITRAASRSARGPRKLWRVTTRRLASRPSRGDVDLALHVGPVDPAEELVLPGLRECDPRRVRERQLAGPDRDRGREEAVAVRRAV